MIRLFITSNPISTILMSVYAARTRQTGTIDVLCIDHYYKKKALIQLIYESATLHTWNHILDFSTHINNDFNLKPTARERVMRKVKHLPVIKGIYNRLLQGYLDKKGALLAEKIDNKLKSAGIDTTQQVELYQLTQTELNAGAEHLFPAADIYYMEHGTVDYIYVTQKPRKKGYICIFKEKYENYLKKRNISIPLYSCLDKDEFTKGFLVSAPGLQKGLQQIEKASGKRFIILLMDALEKFQPDPAFWTDYIDHCLREVKDHQKYTVIIKPHPTQSNEAVEITRAHFKNIGQDFMMLDKPEFANLSVETIYVQYRQNTDYVFSTFSAAIFYLSHFYGEECRFYHSYHFVGRYIKNAPKQYRDSYTGLEELINEVFTNKHCVSLS